MLIAFTYSTLDISRRMFPFYLGDNANHVKTMQIVEYLTGCFGRWNEGFFWWDIYANY